MCGRYVIGLEGINLAEALRERFGVDLPLPQVYSNYNASPTEQLPVVIAGEDGRRLEPMRWNLIPRWQKPGDRQLNAFNARAETVAEKPAFRQLIGRQRCLVPACGYFEWRRTEDGTRYPFYFSLREEPLFAFAGLWEEWRNRDLPESPPLYSYTILTTGANALTAPVHDRMPVILPREHEAEWLSPEVTDPHRLARLYAPFPAEQMQGWPVAPAVNNSRSRGPGLILNSQ